MTKPEFLAVDQFYCDPPPPTHPIQKTMSTVLTHKAQGLEKSTVRASELCQSRGGRRGLHVPNNSYGLYGRKATLNELCGSRGGRRGVHVPNNSYGLYGRKATLNELCGSRGGRRGVHVPNNSYGLMNESRWPSWT